MGKPDKPGEVGIMGKIGTWLGKMIGNSGAEIVSTVGDTIDKFVHTGEEKAAADLAVREIELKFQALQMEADNRLLKDRQSAREMYMHDSLLQKVFAIVFLVGYLAISVLMIILIVRWLGGEAGDVPAWAVSLISTVFGAMSAKVNTIIDFLFGGSQGERDTQKVQAAFRNGYEGPPVSPEQ